MGSKEILNWLRVIEIFIFPSLDNEITVENCEKWLPLIELVSMIKEEDPISAVEYFCMAAVKNSVNERKNIAEDTGVWHLTETNDRFLQGVSYLLSSLLHS